MERSQDNHTLETSQPAGARGCTRAEDVRVGPVSRSCTRLHQTAHQLWNRGFRRTARLLQVVNRIIHGADIDPRARLSLRVKIPHTVGVVIGETAAVDEDVVLMPQVVLGASDSGAAGRRHPHVCARAIIGAGAIVLGPVTIGEDARIGANAVVVTDVPAGATAVGVPAQIRLRGD